MCERRGGGGRERGEGEGEGGGGGGGRGRGRGNGKEGEGERVCGSVPEGLTLILSCVFVHVCVVDKCANTEGWLCVFSSI